MTCARATLRIASGALVWAAHFALAYGVTALACARGAPGSVRWTVGLATLVAAVIAGAIAWHAWRDRAQFASWLTAALAAAALVAILLEGLPALLVPPCA